MWHLRWLQSQKGLYTSKQAASFMTVLQSDSLSNPDQDSSYLFVVWIGQNSHRLAKAPQYFFSRSSWGITCYNSNQLTTYLTSAQLPQVVRKFVIWVFIYRCRLSELRKSIRLSRQGQAAAIRTNERVSSQLTVGPHFLYSKSTKTFHFSMMPGTNMQVSMGRSRFARAEKQSSVEQRCKSI